MALNHGIWVRFLARQHLDFVSAKRVTKSSVPSEVARGDRRGTTLSTILGHIQNMEIRKIQKRIEEIKNILSDDARKKNFARGVTQDFYKNILEKENRPLFNELEKLETQLRFKTDERRFCIDLALTLIAIGSLLVNILVARNNIEENSKINRPYLEIDSSNMKSQLNVQMTDPEIFSEAIKSFSPYPYNDSFSFKITNVGKLPAKYYVDTNEFERPGMTEILSPANKEGILFPSQKLELRYDIKGVHDPQNKENLKKDIEKMESLIKGDLIYASKIKIFYGYPDDKKLSFETLIEEKIVEQNCNEKPTPSLQCYGNPDWIVRTIR